MWNPLESAKVNGAGGEENILAGGAKGELEVQWFWRGGDESKSGVSSRIFKSVFVSFQVILVKVEVKTSLLFLSVHFHFLL